MKLGQGNIFSSVCQEFCPGGAPLHAGIPPGTDTPSGADTTRTRHPHPQDQTPLPQMQTPPRPGTPQDQAPTPWNQAPLPGPGTPLVQCMLGDTGNKRTVRILLECNLVLAVFSCPSVPGTNCLYHKQ